MTNKTIITSANISDFTFDSSITSKLKTKISMDQKSKSEGKTFEINAELDFSEVDLKDIIEFATKPIVIKSQSEWRKNNFDPRNGEWIEEKDIVIKVKDIEKRTAQTEGQKAIKALGKITDKGELALILAGLQENLANME